MQDVMVDLETLGKGAGCAILSIGAVGFDPQTGEIDDGFYTVVSINSCVVHGLRFDEETLEWWGKQSAEARTVLKAAYASDAPRLHPALQSFARYLNKVGGSQSVRLWGNGSDFDNAILASAYKAAGIPPPWKFWDSRCYRTLKNLHPEVALGPRVGTFHNALDDAKTQAAHALAIFAARRPEAIAQRLVEHLADRVEALAELAEDDLLG
jgi:DNA polymerase III epsilon subunit-like protein